MEQSLKSVPVGTAQETDTFTQFSFLQTPLTWKSQYNMAMRDWDRFSIIIYLLK